MNQVFVNDFIDIFSIQVGVPDFLGVDDDDRAKFTAIQTACGIDADLADPGQPEFLDSGLGIVSDRGRIALLAALLALLALVGAEKHMVLIIRHLALR
jgi:hypothetical protein